MGKLPCRVWGRKSWRSKERHPGRGYSSLWRPPPQVKDPKIKSWQVRVIGGKGRPETIGKQVWPLVDVRYRVDWLSLSKVCTAITSQSQHFTVIAAFYSSSRVPQELWIILQLVPIFHMYSKYLKLEKQWICRTELAHLTVCCVEWFIKAWDI